MGKPYCALGKPQKLRWKLVDSLSASGVPLMFRKGDIIFKNGSKSNSVYLYVHIAICFTTNAIIDCLMERYALQHLICVHIQQTMQNLLVMLLSLVSIILCLKLRVLQMLEHMRLTQGSSIVSLLMVRKKITKTQNSDLFSQSPFLLIICSGNVLDLCLDIY